MPTDTTSEFATPEIVQVAARSAAVEWGHLRFADIPQFQRDARARIGAVLAEQGIGTGGQQVTFSRSPSGDQIAIAPGTMIDGGFMPTDRVTVQEIPAGRAAHMRLEAPYGQLPRAWGELMAWVAGQRLQPAGLSWEIYGNDASVPVTDLYMLLK